MSRHRRRQSRSRQPANGASAAASGNGAQAGTNANANRSGAARSGRRDRRARTAVDVFWGDPDTAPQTVERIRPTTDPAAVPRSLGEPPLTPDTAAPHHLAVVYEEAVRAATALAAANGLLGDGPAGGDGDEPTG
jgi:hypothetical protein